MTTTTEQPAADTFDVQHVAMSWDLDFQALCAALGVPWQTVHAATIRVVPGKPVSIEVESYELAEQDRHLLEHEEWSVNGMRVMHLAEPLTTRRQAFEAPACQAWDAQEMLDALGLPPATATVTLRVSSHEAVTMEVTQYVLRKSLERVGAFLAKQAWTSAALEAKGIQTDLTPPESP